MNEAPRTPEPLSMAPVEKIVRSGPWGFWATCGLGLVVAMGWLVVQSLIALVMVYTGTGVDSHAGPAVRYDGDLLGAATIGSGLAAVAMILFFAWIRNDPVPQYLALRLPRRSWVHFPLWFAVIYGLALVFGDLAPVFQQDKIPEFMREAYNSTDYPVLLWMGITVMAPVFEEFLFRGFLYAGWRNSALRWLGTALLTSALWAVIHLQYGWFELSWIFILGIVLCAARELSQSLWVPVAMHAFNNALATYTTEIEMAKEAIKTMVP